MRENYTYFALLVSSTIRQVPDKIRVNIRLIIQSQYKRVFIFSSKITPTCFVNHKIGNIAMIYKFFKTVHF